MGGTLTPGNRPCVVLGADPLLQPSTGIGNYTRSLARSLLELQLVSELSYYFNGVVVTGDSLSSRFAPPADSIGINNAARYGASRLRLLASVRDFLASKSWAAKAYEVLMPVVDRARLYPYRNFVFHSPNYLLPAFLGPTVATFHDLSIQRYPNFHPKARVQLLHKGMAEAARRASHIITDSALVRREVIDYYNLKPGQVTAIPLAADDRFRPRSADECSAVLRPLGLEYRGFLLFSGSVEPRKNIQRICTAYRDLRNSGKLAWPIIFVGGKGWRSTAEHEDIEELISRGWAQYLGLVDDSVLATLYSAARMLVFPSIYEGFGLPALEAQQSNTPVLTSKGSTMAEFASHQDVLVDALDTGAIRDGIEQLMMRESSIHNDVTTTLLPRPADKLSWANTARQTVAVYQRIQLS